MEASIKSFGVNRPLDGGSEWKKGRRVSTRIKSRPLDWWRGERMLYGRVHRSEFILSCHDISSTLCCTYRASVSIWHALASTLVQAADEDVIICSSKQVFSLYMWLLTREVLNVQLYAR